MTFDRVSTDYQQNHSCPQQRQETLTDDLVDYKALIRAKIEELTEQVKKGDAEPAYQIGGQSFTEEEWDNFLGRFDKLWEKIRQETEEKNAKESAKAQAKHEFHRELLEGTE